MLALVEYTRKISKCLRFSTHKYQGRSERCCTFVPNLMEIIIPEVLLHTNLLPHLSKNKMRRIHTSNLSHAIATYHTLTKMKMALKY